MTPSVPGPRRARVAAVILALGASGLALVVGAGLLPAVPADAVTIQHSELRLQVSFGSFGTNPCATSGPGDVNQGPLLVNPDGMPVSATSTSSATFNGADPLDVTNAQADISVTAALSAVGGVLSSLNFTSTGEATVDSAQGLNQTCDATIDAAASHRFEFDLPAARVLLIDANSSSIAGEVVLQNGEFSSLTDLPDNAPIDPFTIEANVSGPHAQVNRTVYLSAGHYSASFEARIKLEAPETAGAPTSRSGSFTVDGEFFQPGAALADESGAGRKFVELGARSCGPNGSLPLIFKRRAGKGADRKINKAVVFVNGVKVKSVRKPEKKKVLMLTDLESTHDLDVEVRLKLVNKGRVAVEREYLRCS